jgi:hypothetical protein
MEEICKVAAGKILIENSSDKWLCPCSLCLPTVLGASVLPVVFLPLLSHPFLPFTLVVQG